MNYQKGMSGQDEMEDDPEMLLLQEGQGRKKQRDQTAGDTSSEDDELLAMPKPILFGTPELPPPPPAKKKMAGAVAEGVVDGQGGEEDGLPPMARTAHAPHDAADPPPARPPLTMDKMPSSRSDLDSAHHAMRRGGSGGGKWDGNAAYLKADSGASSGAASSKEDKLRGVRSSLKASGKEPSVESPEMPDFPLLDNEEEEAKERELLELMRRMSSSAGSKNPVFGGKVSCSSARACRRA